ncbi:beta-lactamase family protein [Aliifodinibius sp. S!AR15-10]|uniref:serine hydrolase domain-containing protein n=1 Tax=Aliifodinibius sp. S!AR15-10 TaxID=2950437 RepID=UPI00285839A8|nr:serine hydrolase domain-containing protein [Aliifodinibius sp. S!AR15-10]MDR8391421.1 beta-lactamase family protein [Aliifodinibius sp. S!AR15-10]
MKKMSVLCFLLFSVVIGDLIAQPIAADSAEVEAFMDGVITSFMEENHIAGAALLISQDGQPVVQKGYGFADVGRQQEVDPESTLFRIGSISKLFVWTAVMQLVEQGQLDLNTDINQYLEEFKIPDTYPEPITLKHLMTHTPGFEDRVINLFALDSSSLRPLGEILTEELPARVRPPGQMASYSNHGTALAAYIVEQVSGLSFQEYADQNILNPLDMDATTFQQPLPERLASWLSKGYAYSQGEFVEKPFEFVPMGPVGGASTTARDMLPFMQANLNLGQYQGQAILDSTTAQLMQSPAFRHAQSVNPMRYGFIDMSQNGITIYGHGGDTFWFHAMMALFPEQDIGFFLAFNSEGGGGTTGKVLEAFVDQYFPDSLASNSISVDQDYLQQFAGEYRSNRYPHKRLTKIISIMSPTTVSVTEEGTLRTVNAGEGTRWIPVDSLTFREVNSSNHLTFERNSLGQITHFYRDDLPIMAFERVPVTASRDLHLPILSVAVVAFLVTIIYWPLAYLIRRNYRPSLIAKPPLPFKYKVVAWVNSLLLLIFYVGMGTSITGPESIVYGISSGVKILLWLPVFSFPITIGMCYLSLKTWQERMSDFWSRISYTLLSLIFLVCLWQIYYWNFWGTNY